jgi:hypothetical protein
MPSAAESEKPEEATATAPIIVDMGKQRAKRIRQLREGRGKLLDQVSSVLDELKANGTIDEAAQPVIIVVRERRRTPALWSVD